jgi:hypothetical protein
VAARGARAITICDLVRVKAGNGKRQHFPLEGVFLQWGAKKYKNRATPLIQRDAANC